MKGRFPMGHKVAEAIIENGKLTYVDKELPQGKIKVHIIYDMEEKNKTDNAALMLKETAGIYKDTDAEYEAKRMREAWERHAGN